MERTKKAAIAVGISTLMFTGLAAAPAKADPVGCASYDFVVWGAGGVPYCFAGVSDNGVTIPGATGINMVNQNRKYRFYLQGHGWTPYFSHVPSINFQPAETITAEEELFL